MISGGITKFAKGTCGQRFQVNGEGGFLIMRSRNLKGILTTNNIDGSIISISPILHLSAQSRRNVQDLSASAQAKVRIEGGAPLAGFAFTGLGIHRQRSLRSRPRWASKLMSHVETARAMSLLPWRRTRNFDFPVGGYYNGYYAMWLFGTCMKFGTTESSWREFGEES